MEDEAGIEKNWEWVMDSIAKYCTWTMAVVDFEPYDAVKWRKGGVRGSVFNP